MCKRGEEIGHTNVAGLEGGVDFVGRDGHGGDLVDAVIVLGTHGGDVWYECDKCVIGSRKAIGKSTYEDEGKVRAVKVYISVYKSQSKEIV